MGDYADDAIDQELDRYISEITGGDDFEDGCPCHTSPPKSKDPLDNVDDDINENIWTESSLLSFNKVIRETEKSWILEMSGGAKTHFSKKYCRIDEAKKTIIAPKWLLCKIAGWL